MRDCTEQDLRESRPDVDGLECVRFCLKRLFEDNQHGIEDRVVGGLTFEELIGALLLAEDGFVEQATNELRENDNGES